MSWSLPLGEVFGVQVRAHLVFVILAALSAARFLDHGVAGALFGVLLVLLFLVSVAFHEVAHAACALRLGLPVRAVLLLPLGGVTHLGRRRPSPGQELVTALSGPLASLGLALLITLAAAFGGLDLNAALDDLSPGWPALLALLISGNVLLGLVNFLPLFPLDGGRMLRALLSWPLGYPRATAVTATFGQVMALSLGIWAVVAFQVVLVLVAAMLFLAASRERREAQVRANLGRLTAGDLWELGTRLEPGERLASLAGTLLHSSKRAFPVFLGERLVGVVVRREVLEAVRQLDDHPYVASVMRRDVPTVASNTAAQLLLEMMQVLETPVLAVQSEAGELLGFVTHERLVEAARGN